jgi:hypothetical protein
LSGDFARVARPCPTDCLQPISAADGVTTFGELEVLDFLEDVVSNREGLVLDTRIPDDFYTGSIPGAVNVPSRTLAADNRYRNDILRALGATAGPNDTLDFSGSMSLTLFGGALVCKCTRRHRSSDRSRIPDRKTVLLSRQHAGLGACRPDHPVIQNRIITRLFK